MQCNICQKNTATVHLTEIINNQIKEIHLCENCAKEKSDEFQSQFSFNDILAGLADIATHVEGKQEEVVCDNCGLTYEGFKKTGRLGCGRCYKVFRRQLLPLIKRVQGATHHYGKSPSTLPMEDEAEIQLRELSNRLRSLIEKEEFEDAAKVRDEIKKIHIQKKPKRSKGKSAE